MRHLPALHTLLLFLGLSGSGLAGVVPASSHPYLGSTAPFLKTSFCQVNRCTHLSTLPVLGHTEETYTVRVPQDPFPHLLTVLRAQGKAVKLSTRVFGQDDMPGLAELALFKFASGSRTLTLDALQKLIGGSERSTIKGALDRSYSVTVAALPIEEYAEIWFSIAALPDF